MNQRIKETIRLMKSPDSDFDFSENLKKLLKDGIEDSLINSWVLLDGYLAYPLSHSPYGIKPFNHLHDDCPEDIESMIHDFEKEISRGSPEPEIYLHVAQYYYKNNRAAKARSILKKGMQSAHCSKLIAVYYCDNLSFSESNLNTFESYLLPVLHSGTEDDAFAVLCAYQVLYYFYLCTEKSIKFTNLVLNFDNGSADNLLSFALFVLLKEYVSNPKKASENFIGWGMKRIDEFYSDAPAEILSKRNDDGEIYGYNVETLIPTLLSFWLKDKFTFFEHLDNNHDSISFGSLNEYEFNGARKALETMLSRMMEITNTYPDSDFWTLIYLHFIGSGSGFVADNMRSIIKRLADEYPTVTMRELELKLITWWGDKSDGSTIIPLLIGLAEIVAEGEQDDYDLEEIFTAVAPNDSSKTTGTRPLPYFSQHIYQSLIDLSPLPHSFIKGFWNEVARPCFLKHHNILKKQDSILLDYFDKEIPNGDPKFVKAFILLEADNYTGSIALFQDLLEHQPSWYALYRNISYAAEKMGNLDVALEYEQMAHDHPDVEIPVRHADTLSVIQKSIKAQELEAEKYEGANVYFIKDRLCQINVDLLDITTTLKLIAYLEYFNIPGTNHFRPILSSGLNWMPSSALSASNAKQMIIDRTAFFINKIHQGGISIGDDGGYMFDFRKMSFAINFEMFENIPLVLGQLYGRFELLTSSLSPDLTYQAVKHFLIADLIEFTTERFESYEIPINFNAGFEKTAEHCLKLFPLTVCYGILYHEIEDAAGAQREKRMSHQHTINYGLKCARNKASNASENNWNLQGYERAKSAAEPSAIISLMHKISIFNL